MGCASSKDLEGGFRPRPTYQQYQQQPQYQQQQPQYQQQQPQFQQQQQPPYGLPQQVIPPSTLPPGWISQFDPTKQRLFYIYPQNNTVTWVHPNGPEADAQEMARFYQIQELQRERYSQVPQGNNNNYGSGINKTFADSYNRHGGMGPGAGLLAGGAVGLLAGGLLAEGLEHHHFGGGYGYGDGFGGGFGGNDNNNNVIIENNTYVDNNNTYIDNDDTYNDNTYNDNTYNDNDNTYNDFGGDNDYSGADFGGNDFGGGDF